MQACDSENRGKDGFQKDWMCYYCVSVVNQQSVDWSMDWNGRLDSKVWATTMCTYAMTLIGNEKDSVSNDLLMKPLHWGDTWAPIVVTRYVGSSAKHCKDTQLKQGHSHWSGWSGFNPTTFQVTTTFLPIFTNSAARLAYRLATTWLQLTEQEINGFKFESNAS